MVGLAAPPLATALPTNAAVEAIVEVLDDEVPTVRVIWVEGNAPHFAWSPEDIAVPDDRVLFYAPGGHHVQTHSPTDDGLPDPPPDGCIDFSMTQVTLVAFHVGPVPGEPGALLVEATGMTPFEVPIAPLGQCNWGEDGAIHYHCDNHPESMRGRLVRA